jgi:DNA-binding NtrC family response regulator
MTQNQERTILLVSDDAALCAAARQELEAREAGLRVAAVSTVEAAHRIIADAAPAVILLEDTSVAADSREHPAHGARLESAVSALAAYAPVVVIGHARHQSDLAQLVADGLADFVAPSNGYLPEALGLVQHRLHHAPKLLSVALPPASPGRRHDRRVWRSAAARVEQSADGYSWQCGAVARGGPAEE